MTSMITRWSERTYLTLLLLLFSLVSLSAFRIFTDLVLQSFLPQKVRVWSMVKSDKPGDLYAEYGDKPRMPFHALEPDCR